jgi:flagellar capping protein FliD
MERVRLKKQVYAKSAVDNVINTGFNQLTPQTPVVPEVQPPNIEEFFTQYSTLFFDIPKFGPTNSHEYLVKTSGEYINATQTNETIQALIEEITQLRQENLELQRQQIQNDIASVQANISQAQQQLNK